MSRPLVPAAYSTKLHNTTSNGAGKFYEDYTTSLDANSPPPAVCFTQNSRSEVRVIGGGVVGALAAEPGAQQQNYIAFDCKATQMSEGAISPTLRTMTHSGSHQNGGGQVAVAFDARQSDVIQYGDKTGPLDTDGHTMGVLHASTPDDGESQPVRSTMCVRRLTPGECELLMGFPKGYTAIPHRGKPAADGPRYKALGNSWAVPVVRWVGMRIDAVMAASGLDADARCSEQGEKKVRAAMTTERPEP